MCTFLLQGKYNQCVGNIEYFCSLKADRSAAVPYGAEESPGHTEHFTS